MPLGFFASPREEKNDSATTKLVKHLHHLLSALAVGCLLTTVVWSTITVNRLTEGRAAPAESVVELIMRDFELQWIGCNVNFLVGLMCFASTIITFSWVTFGIARSTLTCLVSGSLCMMISIVNQQIRCGAGAGLRFSNMPGLILRYWGLLFADVKCGANPLMFVAIGLFITSFVLCARLTLKSLREAQTS
eukprot:CAMPEP_0178406324 /NCGR_PEP_ID=MMETSP0689_2-20121128/18853_1 /TAXON_ID=160604 /ORGANISM="Amphidinium massartii, Strain CS-259" /LENGTH=190 /DNA_ID=CAMNT_0020027361 /DNA_START=219 /DNA_END=791 /DNA_ORIENTATION=+